MSYYLNLKALKAAAWTTTLTSTQVRELHPQSQSSVTRAIRQQAGATVFWQIFWEINIIFVYLSFSASRLLLLCLSLTGSLFPVYFLLFNVQYSIHLRTKLYKKTWHWKLITPWKNSGKNCQFLINLWTFLKTYSTCITKFHFEK